MNDGVKVISWLKSGTFINQKNNTITVQLDDTLKPYILNLKRCFTAYMQGFTLDFKSKYSCSIYEYFNSQSGPLGGSNVTKVEFEDGMKTIPDNICIGGHFVEQFQKVPTPETIIQEVVIPDSVTTIGTSAFSYCEKLSEVKVPSSVTKIGASAFYTCNSLAKVTLPPNITKIESRTFAACFALVDITIPSGITEIGEKAFFRCDSLKSIVIPASVIKMEKDVFASCPKLTAKCEAESKPEGWDDKWQGRRNLAQWGYKNE